MNFRQWRVVGCILLPSFLILTTFNSCEDTLVGNGFESAQSCKSSSSSLVYSLNSLNKNQPSSPFADSKLVLDRTNKKSQKIGRLSNSSLPAGTTLVALMDNQCLHSLPSNQRPTSAKVLERHKVDPSLKRQAFTFVLNRNESYRELAQEIENDPCIIGVGPYREYKPQALSTIFNDPAVLRQKHLKTIRTESAFKDFFHPDWGIPKNSSGQETIIAVLDTGVHHKHEDLQDNLWTHSQGIGLNAPSLNESTTDYDPEDISPVGHGTHVAGLALAESNNSLGVTGVASYGVKLMAVKVFYKDSNGNVVTDNSALVSGMQWALDHGADVINLSLGRVAVGGDLSDPIQESMIQMALKAGAVVVTATGNGTDKYPAQELNDTDFTVLPARYGASYAGAINVGSISIDNEGNSLGRSLYSHYSSHYVEIAAPGETSDSGLYSILPSSNLRPRGSYGYLRGTSQAVPQVSAAAALIMRWYREHFGKNPSPGLVENILLSGATKDPSLGGTFKDGNILNLKGIVRVMQQQYPEMRGLSGSLKASSLACH